jgi:septal ring factor EnvC (AmiA/AmiB activator)
MKRIAVLVPAAVLMAALLVGCDKKLTEELQAQVATLQQQIDANNATLAERDNELNKLRSDISAVQTERDQALENVARLGNELNATKDELAKLKASKTAAAKPAAKTTTTTKK